MSGIKLAGNTAIVTGGSRGNGRGIALTLAAAGADIAFCHYGDDERAKATVADIEALGRKSNAAECDVSSPTAIKKFYADAVSAIGDIDILVNNAGCNVRKPALEVTWEDWNLVLETNLRGLFFLAQAIGDDSVPRHIHINFVINTTLQVRD